MSNEPRLVLVLGYFFRHNIGDDLYVSIWDHLMNKRFKNYQAHIETVEKDPKDIATAWRDAHGPQLPHCIVLGGGDVLTDYFMVLLRNIVVHLAQTDAAWFDVPVHGISVAMPYNTIVNTGCCDVFSSVLVRPCKYIQNLQIRIGDVHRIQDLSVYLLPQEPEVIQRAIKFGRKEMSENWRSGSTLAVSLAAQTCGVGTPYYHGILRGLADALQIFQRRFQCNIMFVPFDTEGAASDDRRVIADLIRLIPPKSRGAYTMLYMADNHTPENIYKRFMQKDIRAVLCMRYHAHMLAMMAMLPIASIAITQKVKSLLEESNMTPLQCNYYPTLNGRNEPFTIDVPALFRTISWAWQNTQTIIQTQAKYVCKIMRELPAMDAAILRSLSEPRRAGVASFRDLAFPEDIACDCVRAILRHYIADCSEDFLATSIEALQKGSSLREILGHVKADASFVASLVCVYLMHDMYPSYHYGMYEKIMDSRDLLGDIQWVIEDNANAIAAKRVNHRMNITGIPLFSCRGLDRPSLQGLHRSGWEYVLRNVTHMHANDDTLPILDDYLDATFNWMHDSLRALRIIPYTRKWVGFFHHTAYTGSGPNNLVSVFANPTFLESLPYCARIVTMSRILSADVSERLRDAGFGHIEVTTLTHPSEFPMHTFSMEAFLNNHKRKLVQIGCWYREPYMLYSLNIPHKDFISKAALRGKHMSSNFPPNQYNIKITDSVTGEFVSVDVYNTATAEGINEESCISTMCRDDTSCNAYVKNMIAELIENQKSVEVIERLTDAQYDELFVSNIVFLHMLDGSAINTLIEAILRNTPILINRLPAIVDVLGDSYPFYYNSATEAALKACSPHLIASAHDYLKQLDKSAYHVEVFIRDLKKVFEGI